MAMTRILPAVMHLLESGHFNLLEPGIFDGICAAIRSPSDPWMTAADFRSYIDAQARAGALWADQDQWWRRAILNVAGSGRFSSDRTIGEYARDIWFREAG
jgi:starch phosphorylase